MNRYDINVLQPEAVATLFQINDTNGNPTYIKNLITGLEEWMEYFGTRLISYRNTDGKYIEYDNETGEPTEFTIPIAH